MTQPAKSLEPSMEEILASIRRIIADDEPKKPAASPPPPPPPAAPPSAVVAPPPPRAAAQRPPALGEQDIETALAGLRPGRAPEPPVQNQTRHRTVPSAPAQPPASFQAIESQPDRTFGPATAAKLERPARPEREFVRGAEGISRQTAENSRQSVEGTVARPLLSPSTSAAIDTSFHALAHTVLVQNTSTLEDIVREMLRPMLKTWLDDNLPGLVERLVRAEIERVSRSSG
jgi:cell pole-organizing protein PopZ